MLSAARSGQSTLASGERGRPRDVVVTFRAAGGNVHMSKVNARRRYVGHRVDVRHDLFHLLLIGPTRDLSRLRRAIYRAGIVL
jgi:hypothetical protein